MNSDYEFHCSKSEVDLHSMPPLNISMDQGQFIAHQPVSSLDSHNGPIEFHIPSSTDQYIDLGRTKLYLSVKVVKRDGTDIAENQKVAPVNLLLHSLFSQVDLKLKDTLVTTSLNTYPYKSYLETLLSYGSEAKATHKTCEGWYHDEGADWDIINPEADTTNEGFLKRHALIAKSRRFELIGRLHIDILQQHRYLIPGVDISLKLVRSEPQFYLVGDNNGYYVKIEEAVLYSRKVKINPTIAVHHEKLLSEGELVKYPIRRGVVTTCTIATGSLSFHKDNIVSGQLPRRVIIGLVTNAAFNGNVARNPFKFEHFTLNYITLNNGTQSFPSQPLQPNFEQNKFLQAYEELVSAVGFTNENKGFGVNREDYPVGNTLFGFDLTPDLCEGPHVDPIVYGNLKLEIHFERGLAQPVNVVVYSEFDSCLKIDKARNILVDYHHS